MMQNSDQDYHNFSTPSSHRLPTVSGTQAIRDAVQHSQPICSGLASLDAILSSTGASQGLPGGFRRGVVTEIFGPPGVGKTSLALQASVNAMLYQKSKVTWIDTSSSLVFSRLQELLDGAQNVGISLDQPSQQESLYEAVLEDFCYLEATSLPKLLALFLHPITEFPPPGTTLVVLDDLSNLILSTLPRKSRQTASATSQKTPTKIRNDYATKQAISRRTQVISGLASALQTFAAAKNVAVLVTCKASINLKVGQQAFLRPALTSQQWDACLGNRIALYRDFWPGRNSVLASINAEMPQPSDFERMSLRYAQVVGSAGREVSSNEVGFVIETNGLREMISLTDSIRPSVPMIGMQTIFGSDDVVADEEITNSNTIEPKQDAASSESESESESIMEVHLHKRKIAEIADSEDENMQTNARATMTHVSDPSNNQMSRILQFDDAPSQDRYFPSFQTAKKLRFDENNSQISVTVETASNGLGSKFCKSDEMLLDQVETETPIPAFSQAAADLSDPLTPSDDGGHSP